MPIDPLEDGVPMNASTFNTPLQQLSSQVDQAVSLFRASARGQSYYLIDIPIDPSLSVGMPVYWNPDTARCEAAIASATTNDLGQFILTPASDCIGIVTEIHSGNTADVIMDGIAEIDLSAVVTGEIENGRYYLSTTTPGRLAKDQPPVSVFVCRVLGKLDGCRDNPQVLVRPVIRDSMLDHTHYRFQLACLPAGNVTPPSYGSRHTITSASASRMGWLPANHASFGGTAPTNAVFGYNLAMHPQLDELWPPIPLGSVALLLDHGFGDGATEVPLGEKGLVICDTNGIWWMSSCYGDVPWPTHLNNTVDPDSSATSAVSDDECPRVDIMRLELIYLRMLVANDNFVVTSISTSEGSPIALTGKTGANGFSGDVTVNIDTSLSNATDDATGGIVVKTIDNNLQTQSGWVVEGLTTNSAGLTLTGTATRYEDPEDSNSALVHQGIVNLELDVSPVDRELLPVWERLNGSAVEKAFEDTPYIGFPVNKVSEVRVNFNVPPSGLPASPKLRIKMLLLCRATGTLPAITLTYRRVPMLTVGDRSPLPTTDSSLSLTTGIGVTAGDSAQVQSGAISVVAGDTVYVTVKRNGDSSYAGEVGILRLGAIISDA